ncbi:hypothetical protein Pcinc_011624 [Petrolisthes cinctipes]|uniref:Uncharacterized protein n=1 Tax=Petrolisthes cinctipes TaxID=88211 RepID=A0AAE1G6G6_PETCI|nr:hypothetical protein Pcinc_011624 [Petrolisthes cinctipes]
MMHASLPVTEERERERDVGGLEEGRRKTLASSCPTHPSEHIAKVAAKANSRLGIIKRNFVILSGEILVPLYLFMVRPILDYGVPAWSPYLVGDIQALEKMQRRATKLVPELSHLTYEEICHHQGLQTLQERRMKSDMIQEFKLMHGYDDVQYTKFFTLNTNNLRGHSLKLAKPDHWRTTLRGNWFAIRVIDKWNALPESVVTAPSIAAFKFRYDRHQGIEQ